MKCSNCEQEVSEPSDALLVTRGPLGRAQIAVICRNCEDKVLMLKIVLARSAASSEFAFEGYLPVSSVK